MKSDFFIDRPVFSIVISIIIVLVGFIGLMLLPVDQYPQIVPPVVKISASYPGASAQTVAQAVATPIEQELNGTPGMLYMESTNTNSGSFSATLTFDISSDPDLAAVEVQNRVKLAESRLPAEVVQNGISVEKEAASRLMTITVLSDDPKFDEIYLSNYTTLNVLDMLRRVPGVGRVSNVGSRYYGMQIWVQPDKLASLGLTVDDLTSAIKDQNRESAAGVLGQQPISDVDVTIPITATGRLSSVSQFENIVVRTGDDGAIIRIKDVARVSLEAQSYNTESGINGGNAAVMYVYTLPGANAMQVAEDVKATMEEISKNFPDGITYDIPFDMTTYISESIHHVYKTLFEALFLVILVVFLSLQSWRATIIPAIAVPISLIGTFGIMLVFGFSLNMMTLLGLILAIGIVVDDAIVVVENVDRIMAEENLPPYEATKKAMSGIGSALIAMSLVLCAVFIPVSFLSGITGQLFRQFTITIAVSVIISTIVALTLSPVMCSRLLKPHDANARKNFLFRKINQGFDAGNSFYAKVIHASLRHSPRMFVLFGVTVVCIWAFSQLVPKSFMPQEDQGYFTVELELPVGATLERTREVTDRAMDFLLRQHDIEYVLNVTGSSPRIGTSQSNSTLTVIMKPWNEREETDINKMMQMVRDTLSLYPESKVYISSPAVIPGLGTSGGFSMVLEARGDATYDDLQAAADTLLFYASQRKELTGLASGIQKNIPQLYFDADRDKIQLLEVPLSDVFSTLKAFTGSIYVNDFNMYNRVYRVYLQADAPYRAHKDNLNLFFVKSDSGAMIPVTALGNTQYTTGPGTIKRFNMYYSATITGEAGHGVSSGQAMDILEEIADEHLPSNIDIEWSGLSFQEKKEGGQTGLVLGLALLFVFLVLAAQYESWSVPIAVILSLPIAIAGAYLGIWIVGLESNVYFQIGLVMLVGLVAKNAILIVEFAKEEVEKGKPIEEAAVTAAHLRFRPIVMTSLAFILGMLPLVFATGPGSASRQNIGTGVFFGMIVAITLGITFVPFFFVWIYKLKNKMSGKSKVTGSGAAVIAAVIIAGSSAASCSPAKHCAEPELNLPEQYMAASPAADSLTLADVKWWELYADTTLQNFIKQALEYNKDMLIAAERIRELECRYRIQRSELWPSISAKAYANNEYNNYGGNEANPNDPELGPKIALRWEIDIWGHLRWASREKMAEYLASIEAQRALQMTLVSEVAKTYFELLSLDNELEIVRRTLETRQEGVKQAKLRADGGLTSEIPHQQALVELATTASLVPDLERKVAVKESELAFLTGTYPHEMKRPRQVLELSYRDILPTGIPSQLLERRPDLMESWQRLRAAEAAVGVAQAERFPTFVIDLSGGLESNSFLDVLKSPFYYAAAGIASPIFEFGKRKAAFRAAISEYNQAKLEYEKNVMQAVKEVYDAVVTFNSARENTNLKFDLQEASRKYVSLASSQYINGILNYLDVLDAQRSYFDAQVELSNAIANEYIALTELYKALGGGW
ncbi:MAG: multidrug efflux RND transporter permease subunit [Bacteroidetes bacterium]|uniref:Multidrug efflux RND transporter permease subunit n=1 Tax=Candidatus Cryptobacteroides gallistercoris TaxID=2840765 RepID=A0A940DMR9_9BACT|nr:multidrug efflux RND transporter permease subunit [Candidatus Cryptobacteroides gallistercoris]